MNLTQSALNELDRRVPGPKKIAIEGQAGLKSLQSFQPNKKVFLGKAV